MDIATLIGLVVGGVGVLLSVRAVLISVINVHKMQLEIGKLRIEITSPDGVRKEVVLPQGAGEPLTEGQLKELVKVLAEADHGRS